MTIVVVIFALHFCVKCRLQECLADAVCRFHWCFIFEKPSLCFSALSSKTLLVDGAFHRILSMWMFQGGTRAPNGWLLGCSDVSPGSEMELNGLCGQSLDDVSDTSRSVSGGDASSDFREIDI